MHCINIVNIPSFVSRIHVFYSPTGKVFFEQSELNLLPVAMTEGVGVRLIIHFLIDLEDHSVCSATVDSRRKREAASFDGEILRRLISEDAV